MPRGLGAGLRGEIAEWRALSRCNGPVANKVLPLIAGVLQMSRQQTLFVISPRAIFPTAGADLLSVGLAKS